MDGEVVKTFAAAVAGGLTSLAMLPMLFKGKLRFDRELTVQATHYEREIALRDKMIGERDDENDRMLADNAGLRAELKEQSRAMAEQTREVLNAVKMLQSLAGLAAQERRRSGDD
jgi:hypothetical protein